MFARHFSSTRPSSSEPKIFNIPADFKSFKLVLPFECSNEPVLFSKDDSCQSFEPIPSSFFALTNVHCIKQPSCLNFISPDPFDGRGSFANDQFKDISHDRGRHRFRDERNARLLNLDISNANRHGAEQAIHPPVFNPHGGLPPPPNDFFPPPASPFYFENDVNSFPPPPPPSSSPPPPPSFYFPSHGEDKNFHFNTKFDQKKYMNEHYNTPLNPQRFERDYPTNRHSEHHDTISWMAFILIVIVAIFVFAVAFRFFSPLPQALKDAVITFWESVSSSQQRRQVTIDTDRVSPHSRLLNELPLQPPSHALTFPVRDMEMIQDANVACLESNNSCLDSSVILPRQLPKTEASLSSSCDHSLEPSIVEMGEHPLFHQRDNLSTSDASLQVIDVQCNLKHNDNKVHSIQPAVMNNTTTNNINNNINNNNIENCNTNEVNFMCVSQPPPACFKRDSPRLHQLLQVQPVICESQLRPLPCSFSPMSLLPAVSIFHLWSSPLVIRSSAVRLSAVDPIDIVTELNIMKSCVSPKGGQVLSTTASRESLFSLLSSGSPSDTIVVSAHGGGHGSLLFEDGAAGGSIIPCEEAAALLAGLRTSKGKPPRLILLNVCRSKKLATCLVKRGVGSVIFHHGKVTGGASCSTLRTLFLALANGRSFKEACELLTSNGLYGSGVGVLVHPSQDPSLSSEEPYWDVATRNVDGDVDGSSSRHPKEEISKWPSLLTSSSANIKGRSLDCFRVVNAVLRGLKSPSSSAPLAFSILDDDSGSFLNDTEVAGANCPLLSSGKQTVLVEAVKVLLTRNFLTYLDIKTDNTADVNNDKGKNRNVAHLILIENEADVHRVQNLELTQPVVALILKNTPANSIRTCLLKCLPPQSVLLLAGISAHAAVASQPSLALVPLPLPSLTRASSISLFLSCLERGLSVFDLLAPQDSAWLELLSPNSLRQLRECFPSLNSQNYTTNVNININNNNSSSTNINSSDESSVGQGTDDVMNGLKNQLRGNIQSRMAPFTTSCDASTNVFYSVINEGSRNSSSLSRNPSSTRTAWNLSSYDSFESLLSNNDCMTDYYYSTSICISKYLFSCIPAASSFFVTLSNLASRPSISEITRLRIVVALVAILTVDRHSSMKLSSNPPSHPSHDRFSTSNGVLSSNTSNIPSQFASEGNLSFADEGGKSASLVRSHQSSLGTAANMSSHAFPATLQNSVACETASLVDSQMTTAHIHQSSLDLLKKILQSHPLICLSRGRPGFIIEVCAAANRMQNLSLWEVLVDVGKRYSQSDNAGFI